MTAPTPLTPRKRAMAAIESITGFRYALPTIVAAIEAAAQDARWEAFAEAAKIADDAEKSERAIEYNSRLSGIGVAKDIAAAIRKRGEEVGK